MPSFSSLSSIRVASQDYVLRLKVTHKLAHGSQSDAVHCVKGRLPKDLDVLWLSNITISLSGSLDGQEIPANDIARSGLMHNLGTQLKANADRLGLNNVSRPFVDDTDGLPKLTLTPSRPLPVASRPHANLVSLHLCYIWRRVTERSDVADFGQLAEEINPFSSTLFLPAETLLNRVTEQLLIYHLVSRYPLIFGPWCKRLDLEMPYFPSIARSIVEIMTRSENHKFMSKCKRLIKVARRQHKVVFLTALATLSACIDDAASGEEMDEPAATPVLTDEEVLCASLEQMFRGGVPQRRFKPAARDAPQIVSLPEDDNSLLNYVPDVLIDDEDSWVELHEVATSTLTEPPKVLSEDMDVFAGEDWPEGGMWRLHDVDVGLDECQSDDQLDRYLIGGSISLASINTRSAQARPFALYHHETVDDGELDPATSGFRREVSQPGYCEHAETPAVFANETHAPSHEPPVPYYSENYEQVMWYAGTCQVDSEGFEPLEGGSDRSEGADSDSILLELDVPEGADVTGDEEPLV